MVWRATVKNEVPARMHRLRGQVGTPPQMARLMVEKLFAGHRPLADCSLLDPGSGCGAFIAAVLNWCEDNDCDAPRITAIESDALLLEQLRHEYAGNEKVIITHGDFLLTDIGSFDFIIGNPPYVRLEGLSETERATYKARFETATNRFDLYILFFEKALKCLKPDGRLVFVTPEKFEYTSSASQLRRLMARYKVEEIHHLDENAFENLMTYPAITSITNRRRGGERTSVLNRDGSSTTVALPADGSSWLPAMKGHAHSSGHPLTLEDACLRISCGVATGLDEIFLVEGDRLPPGLKRFAVPTVGGRDLFPEGIQTGKKMIVPYGTSGLLDERTLEPFLDWASQFRTELSKRTCVVKGDRKWYAFHENPPMKDIFRPKILCKDIAKVPRFWPDKEGRILPRHSVYYIVPKDPEALPALLEYLNGEFVSEWLSRHCQRAGNGFIRLQSNVLKKIPLPKSIIDSGSSLISYFERVPEAQSERAAGALRRTR